MITVGTTVVICKEPPYKNDLCVGDIGVVTYASRAGKYGVKINDKTNSHYPSTGDFWIPRDCIKQYQFKQGDRIVITSKTSRYKGYTGTFKSYYHRPYGSNYVELFVDGTDYQPNSRITYYDGKKHIHDSCLKLVETSITLLNANQESEANNMAKLLTGYNKVAGIKLSGVTYYYALYDEDIKVGDSVLVSGTCEKVVTVTEVLTLEEAKVLVKKEILAEVKCKVDLSAYEQRVQNRAKAAELRREMDKKIAEMDELNKYVLYAEQNPELAEMLKAYKALV